MIATATSLADVAGDAHNRISSKLALASPGGPHALTFTVPANNCCISYFTSGCARP